MPRPTDWERFVRKYKPVKNHLDTYASGDGFMFETFGEEEEFIKAQPEEKIWTLVDADGKEYIEAGWHFVNRLGYFVTEKSFTSPDESYKY